MQHYKILLLTFIILLTAACQDGQATPTPADAVTAVATAAATTAPDQTDPADTVAAEATATETAVPTQTPTPAPPTPTPLPPKELAVCISGEPVSLYLYGDDSLAATAVRHAIYENLYTTLGYSYQPQGLTKLPNLEDGDALIQAVNVKVGDQIVNSAGKVVKLLPGTQIVNADGEIVIYEPPAEGEPPVKMQQMVVDFTFQPLVWSDGTPVTAEDSVFSFQVAADPATPGDKSRVARTAVYEATDDLTVQWKGVPGFLDPTYFTNVWSPLPAHQLAEFSAEELLTADETNRLPLASGPFQVIEWLPGERISLTRNPHYYRQAEGLPAIDSLLIIPVTESASWPELLETGQCDVITKGLANFSEIPALLAEAQDGNLTPYFTPDVVFEHLDFGINSWDYGDARPDGRPDWFDFLTVRQAMAQCINRQRISDDLFAGQAPVMDAYIPREHPQFPETAVIWPYDPETGNALLTEFGLEDTNGDGWRELVDRDLAQTIVATTTFSITLGANSESDLRLRVNELIQEDLAQCGIQVNLVDVPAETWYDDGPFSPLFGRRFDLATFAWHIDMAPACRLYLSSNITGPEELGFGGWSNVNATGWGNEEYDVACGAALASIGGTEAYNSNHQEAARIFTDRLPSIPLFQYIHTAVTAPTVRNFQPDSTQPSELWNVFAWDIESR